MRRMYKKFSLKKYRRNYLRTFLAIRQTVSLTFLSTTQTNHQQAVCIVITRFKTSLRLVLFLKKM
jgi:hypothetical protein